MDYSDQFSAIDDSYEPVHFTPAGAPRAPTGGKPVTYEPYNGPRSGHWTVASTINGSGIDDRCPTVHRGIVGSSYGIPGQIQPIPRDALKKLAQATEDEKKAKEEADENVHSSDDPNKNEKQAQAAVAVQPHIPKGFYVPKTNTRGIRIKGKDGRSEVMKQPQLSLPATKMPVKNAGDVQQPNPRWPSPQPSVKSMKEASVHSRTSRRSAKVIRIVSKDGQEAFMEIPTIQPSSEPAAQATPTAKAKNTNAEAQTVANEKQAEKKAKQEKAMQDANAARVARELRDERAKAEQQEQQRAEAAKAAAIVMMSGASSASERVYFPAKKPSVQSAKGSSKAKASPTGALSGSEQVYIPAKQPSVHSAKGSSKVSAPPAVAVSNNASKPASVASSKTSVQSPQKTASTKVPSQTSQKAPSQTSRQSSHPSQKVPSQPPKPSSNSGWQELGEATTKAAPSENHLQHSRLSSEGSQQPPSQLIKPPSEPGWQDLGRATTKTPPLENHQRYPSAQSKLATAILENAYKATPVPSQHTTPPVQTTSPPSVQNSHRTQQPPFASHDSLNQPSTIFAGRGWISPHPLSVVGSERDQAPEPAIPIPNGNGTMMTFDEWQDLRQSVDKESAQSFARRPVQGERRNISRTNSSAGSHTAGTWGYRAADVQSQPSQHGSVQQSQGWESRYKSPTVETVRSSRHSSVQRSQLESVRSGSGGDGVGHIDGAWDDGSKVHLRMPWDQNF